MRKGLMMILCCMLLLPLTGKTQGCAVCTKTAAGLDDKTAKGMNGGILYLAAFPLTILGTLGLIWWRSNKAEEETGA